MSGGLCIACDIGYYCDGSGEKQACPSNSTTSRTKAFGSQECVCKPGYQRTGTSCQPCPREFYKPGDGDEQCSDRCPPGADSELGAVRRDDCFCKPNHTAELDERGDLAGCANCLFYSGLTCPGGFEKNGSSHAQPLAKEGWFRTGNITAIECTILQANSTSVCIGGTEECQAEPGQGRCSGDFPNECVQGSTGVLCGECSEGYARELRMEPCTSCIKQNMAWLLATILFDMVQISGLNFAMAWIVARGASQVKFALHSAMIRQVLHWKNACSILTDFELDRLLPFPWSERQAEAEDRCAGASCSLLRFPWPRELKAALDDFFTMLDVLPSANVYFSIACRSEKLFDDKDDKVHAKRLVPSLYYLGLPILSATCTILLCGILVYIVVPSGKKCGIFFSEAARETGPC